jgi:prolipoprotein diacylglyceryltransferase
VPLALITLAFDPYLHLGDRAVRWEALALAGTVLAALVLAALIAGRTVDPFAEPPGDDEPDVRPDTLRRDDLLFIALGVVPGAVVGGRLEDVATHWDYYAASAGRILDPGSGSLGLLGGVALGALTGAYVARLLDAPVRRWLHVATVPTLLVLGLGKLAMALGGTGQGVPSDLPWATEYGGPGPWGSLGPAVPSHPAQVYEALAIGVVLVAILVLGRGDRWRAADGWRFFLALGAWAVGRALIAGFWRDPAVVGALRADQLLGLAVAVLCIGLLLVLGRWPATRDPGTAAGGYRGAAGRLHGDEEPRGGR